MARPPASSDQPEDLTTPEVRESISIVPGKMASSFSTSTHDNSSRSKHTSTSLVRDTA